MPLSLPCCSVLFSDEVPVLLSSVDKWEQEGLVVHVPCGALYRCSGNKTETSIHFLKWWLKINPLPTTACQYESLKTRTSTDEVCNGVEHCHYSLLD